MMTTLDVLAERAHPGQSCHCYHCDTTLPNGLRRLDGIIHLGLHLGDRFEHALTRPNGDYALDYTARIFLNGQLITDAVEAMEGPEGYVVRLNLPAHSCSCDLTEPLGTLDQSHYCCRLETGHVRIEVDWRPITVSALTHRHPSSEDHTRS